MKIALAGSGTRGDIQPLVLVAEALRARGHEVRLFVPPNFADLAARHEVPFAPVGLDVQAYFAEHKQVTSTPLSFARSVVELMSEDIRLQFEQLPHVIGTPDIVVGGGMHFSSGATAEALRLPYLSIAYAPSMFSSTAHPPMLIPWDIRAPAVNLAIWTAHTAAYNWALRARVNAHRKRLGLRSTREIFRSFRGDHVAVATDPQIWPIPDDIREFATQTSAITEPSGTMSARVEQFLADGPPPIYLGFGSMGNADPVKTVAMIDRVAQRLSTRFVLGQGWADMGDAELPASCLAVGDVSHLALFPRMAAIFHHGGAGTTAAASRSGAPQWIVPHIVDQFQFAARLHRLGVSPPPVQRKELSAERLATAARECLQSERLRERSRALALSLQGTNGIAEIMAMIEARVRQSRDSRP